MIIALSAPVQLENFVVGLAPEQVGVANIGHRCKRPRTGDVIPAAESDVALNQSQQDAEKKQKDEEGCQHLFRMCTDQCSNCNYPFERVKEPT